MTGQEKIIAAFDRMIKTSLQERLFETELPALAGCRRLLILRSAPVPVFEQFLTELKKAAPALDLCLAGKEGDPEIMEQIWRRPYRFVRIEGFYTIDKLRAHQTALSEFDADAVLFFNWSIPDENYMNIYELVEQLGYEHVYSCDFDLQLAVIKNIKQYMNTLRLHLAMGKWYWGELDL